MMTRKKNRSYYNRQLALGLVAVAASAAAQPVAACCSPVPSMSIELTVEGSITAAQFDAFRQAADSWEGQLFDPITVRISISVQPLDGGELAQGYVPRVDHPWSTVRLALIVDADSDAERAAATLLDNAALNVTYQLFGDSVPPADTETDAIRMTRANAKALGLGTDELDTGIDGRIVFNLDLEDSFDYDPSNGIEPGKTDFVALAAQAIGHVLGFVGGTDHRLCLGICGPPQAHTLDIWRFQETGGAHDLALESRPLYASDAEYFDNAVSIPLSHGVNDVDPNCPTPGMSCSASHWSGEQSRLMVPVLPTGTAVPIGSGDRRALDRIGYDPRPLVYCCLNGPDFAAVRWWQLGIANIPWFPDFAIPDLVPVDPPEDANLGMNMALDLGDLGQRGAIGFAKYVPARQIEQIDYLPNPGIPGTMNLNPPRDFPAALPPAIEYLEFFTDSQAGEMVRFLSTCGSLGCQFDAEAGPFGGYRITGFLDGAGDGIAVRGAEPDVDGTLTLVLQADEGGAPDPDNQNVFEIDPDDADSVLVIHEPAAFGLQPIPDSDGDGLADNRDNCTGAANGEQRDTDGDGIGNLCDADFNQDCTVNFSDLGVMKTVFFTDDENADMDGNGSVDFGDLGRLKQAFFASYAIENPSGRPNLCGS